MEMCISKITCNGKNVSISVIYSVEGTAVSQTVQVDRLMTSSSSFNSSTYKDKNLTIQMNKWRTGTARLWNTDRCP